MPGFQYVFFRGGDVEHQGIAGRRVDGHDRVDRGGIVRRVINAPTVRNQLEPRHVERLRLIDAAGRGIAHEHRRIAAAQCHGKAPLVIDCIVEVVHTIDIDHREDGTEKGAIRSADPAADEECLSARAVSRCINQGALGIEQVDAMALRRVHHPRHQEPVHIAALHEMPELIRSADSQILDVRLRLCQYEIDRLNVARCLVGQDDAEAPHVGAGVRNGLAARILDNDAGIQEAQQRQEEANDPNVLVEGRAPHGPDRGSDTTGTSP